MAVDSRSPRPRYSFMFLADNWRQAAASGSAGVP